MIAVPVLTYLYGQKAQHIVLGFPLLMLVAAYLTYEGVTADRPLLIKHLIELTPAQARYVLTGFALIIAGAAFAILIGFLSNRKRQPSIMLDGEAITAPKSIWSKADVRIKFTEIERAGLQSIKKQKLLKIFHPGGTLTIPATMLPDEGEFDDLVNQLASRMEISRPS